MEEKDFDGWIKVKEKLHFGASQPYIKEGDIWWCSFSENVGVEINGKNKLFSRPALIYKKLSRFGFIGIPLTSQDKHGSWYIKFDFQNRKQTLVLSQLRAFSVSRLSSRMGELNADDMKSIMKSLLIFLG